MQATRTSTAAFKYVIRVVTRSSNTTKQRYARGRESASKLTRKHLELVNPESTEISLSRCDLPALCQVVISAAVHAP